MVRGLGGRAVKRRPWSAKRREAFEAHVLDPLALIAIVAALASLVPLAIDALP